MRCKGVTVEATQHEERPVTKWDLAGIPDPIKWGFPAVLLFMTAVGVESNFLTPHLVAGLNTSEATVSWVITGYSLTVLVASYLSGALADLFGPKRVMLAGAAVFIVFQFAFIFAISTGNLHLVGLTYFIRGFGFPLFAFAFLVWINHLARPSKLGTAIGWFYVMFTGGLPTLGSLVAFGVIPAFGGGFVGETAALYVSIALAAVGTVLAWFGCRDQTGMRRLAEPAMSNSKVLMSGLQLLVSNSKVRDGFLVRMINTAPQFGMFIILPAVISDELGWGQSRWLMMTVIVYAGNILFNAVFGAIGDKHGWVSTVRYFGILTSSIALLAWWYVPHWVEPGSTSGYVLAVIAGTAYGIFLAGFVPMGAIVAANAPGQEGGAMAMYTTAAGGATFLGSLVVAVVLNVTGWFNLGSYAQNTAVVWAFVALYAVAFILVGRLRTRQDDPEYRKELKRKDAALVDAA
ncbi:RbtT/DalT/CsbX family MFS transporter [Corynebacterium sp. Marseille-P8863]|uniref:RbtT/DalT/CsbX family MFS transporter n=1 Tax=Corynebacterium sp. Marseille-P8863 TaxID=2866576 RepID=UPI002264A41B|nr:RbtT/DalT/CsbX family MFS transporter [Corynebacterium sp. Marseille-P8863]